MDEKELKSALIKLGVLKEEPEEEKEDFIQLSQKEMDEVLKINSDLNNRVTELEGKLKGAQTKGAEKKGKWLSKLKTINN